MCLLDLEQTARLSSMFAYLTFWLSSMKGFDIFLYKTLILIFNIQKGPILLTRPLIITLLSFKSSVIHHMVVIHNLLVSEDEIQLPSTVVLRRKIKKKATTLLKNRFLFAEGQRKVINTQCLVLNTKLSKRNQGYQNFRNVFSANSTKN